MVISKKDNQTSSEAKTNPNENNIKGWLTGKLAFFLIGIGTGYLAYKTEAVPKLVEKTKEFYKEKIQENSLLK